MFATDLKSPLLRRLDELAHLQDGWDGEASLAPGQALVDKVQILLRHLPTEAWDAFRSLTQDLYATPYGTIMFDWTLPDGRVAAAIETSEDGFSGFVFLPNQEAFTFEGVKEACDLPTFLRDFFRARHENPSYFLD